MAAETFADKSEHAKGIDRALVVKVYQLIGGEYLCYCGAPAVLQVSTQPDGEPGVTCYEHAMLWIDLSMATVRQLFGGASAH